MQSGDMPRDLTDVAATRWQLRLPVEDEPLEFSAREVLQWLRETAAADPQRLDAASLRRRYEKEWLRVEDAVSRIVREDYEVRGARIAAACSAALLPAALRLGVGGTVVEALALGLAVAAGGGLIVAWRGVGSVTRLVALELIATLLVTVPALGGVAGLATAVYLPSLVLACAAVAGARVGRLFAAYAVRRIRAQAHRGRWPVRRATEQEPARHVAAA